MTDQRPPCGGARLLAPLLLLLCSGYAVTSGADSNPPPTLALVTDPADDPNNTPFEADLALTASEACTYVVEWGPNLAYGSTHYYVTPATSLWHTFDELAGDAPYSYRVTATDAGGKTASLLGSFTTDALDSVSDTDADGMRDSWELYYFSYGLPLMDGSTDTDGDGLLDVDEYRFGTSPVDVDTDCDGLSDRYEYDNGLDPVNSPLLPPHPPEDAICVPGSGQGGPSLLLLLAALAVLRRGLR